MNDNQHYTMFWLPLIAMLLIAIVFLYMVYDTAKSSIEREALRNGYEQRVDAQGNVLWFKPEPKE